MAVTATSYEAQVSAALIAMLATSAAFTAAGGASANIAEDDGGLAHDPKNHAGGALDLSDVWAVVRVMKCTTRLRAFDSYGHEGDAQILIVVPRGTSESHTDWMRRTRNISGGVRDDMNAMWGTVIGSVPTPAAGDVTATDPIAADATSALAGSCFIHLEIAWRDIP